MFNYIIFLTDKIIKATIVVFYLSLGIFIYFLFLSDEGPMLEMLDYTIRIVSTPTFLYFDYSWTI